MKTFPPAHRDRNLYPCSQLPMPVSCQVPQVVLCPRPLTSSSAEWVDTKQSGSVLTKQDMPHEGKWVLLLQRLFKQNTNKANNYQGGSVWNEAASLHCHWRPRTYFRSVRPEKLKISLKLSLMISFTHISLIFQPTKRPTLSSWILLPIMLPL